MRRKASPRRVPPSQVENYWYLQGRSKDRSNKEGLFPLLDSHRRDLVQGNTVDAVEPFGASAVVGIIFLLVS
jgi:hypothetical protein